METNNKLQGDYGELIFEHFCVENKYAYIGLENIYNNLRPDNRLKFRYGYSRIDVVLPDEIVEEVKRICRPSNNQDHEPSFVFDYFTVCLKYNFSVKEDSKGNLIYSQAKPTTSKDFSWVEVKTGKSKLSPNQKKTLNECKIWVYLFRIPAEIPETIQVLWNRINPPEKDNHLVKENSNININPSVAEIMSMGYSQEEAMDMLGII